MFLKKVRGNPVSSLVSMLQVIKINETHAQASCVAIEKPIFLQMRMP